eukprot:GFUD01008986.1.p1 GENE.GFUD01008986.1~~GFUD01008986.1.p1  ORF type:complete len:166 (-),score=49.00 GFUD01008986.1:138-635(-)
MFVLCLTLLGLVSTSVATPIGPKTAAAGVAALAIAAKLAEDECDDVGIEDNMCAVLYDEQKCKRSSSYLSLRDKDEGVLPLFTTGLRRNDVESLIVRYRCKLELWDDDEGLKNGDRPDLVIDRTSRTNLGRNKYVDNLGDEDEYKHLDEKISAYRCTCRESSLGK